MTTKTPTRNLVHRVYVGTEHTAAVTTWQRGRATHYALRLDGKVLDKGTLEVETDGEA